MKLYYTRKAATALAASALIAGIALAGCSSGGSSSNGGDNNTDHGPITFAMGKNDTDQIKPVI